MKSPDRNSTIVSPLHEGKGIPLDTMKFDDEDPVNRLMRSTVLLDHKDPKENITV